MAMQPDILQMLKAEKAKKPAQTGETPAETEVEMQTTEVSGVETPPMASPMSTPEPKMGSKEAAMISVQTAMDLLEQAIGSVGADSEEGKALMDAVTSLTKKFGKRQESTKELMPMEIMNMIQSLPQAGGATPEQRVAASAPLKGTEAPPMAI
jgi:hypothetical protein